MDFFKQACWLYCQFEIHRYLMCNAHGRHDGAEKAMRHEELCSFYVAAVKGVADTRQVRKLYEGEYRAVHDKTQELTDYLDEMIGFPLDCRPDYDTLAPLFFEKFHALALEALGTTPGQTSPATAGVASHTPQCEMTE